MLLICAHFHGETCPGLALAVRAVCYATERWRIGRMHPDLIVTVGGDGCIADGLQALTGATFGAARLRYQPGNTFACTYSRERLTFQPKHGPAEVEDIMTAQHTDLFDITTSAG